MKSGVFEHLELLDDSPGVTTPDPAAIPFVPGETTLKVGDRVINPPEYIQGGMCNWYGIVTEVTPEGAYIIWGTGGPRAQPYFFSAKKYHQLTFDPRGPILGAEFITVRRRSRSAVTGTVVGVNREGFFVDWNEGADLADHVVFDKTGSWDFGPASDKVPWEHLEVMTYREDLPPAIPGTANRRGFYPLSDQKAKLEALHKFRASDPLGDPKDPRGEVFVKAADVRFTILPSDVDWTGLPDL